MKRNEIERKELKNIVEGHVSTQLGITLIALIITVIVLLILAGVTINLTLGQNGLFKMAEQTVRNYKKAEEEELAELDKFDIKLEELEQQTTGNYKNLGTIVKTEDNINYTADGIGNIIPVPVGFVPLTGTEQGTKLTGFVIKDVSVDEDGKPSKTYGNEFVWVPVDGMGYTYNRYAMLLKQPEDGIDEITQNTKIKYASDSSYYFTEAMPIDEEKSVAKYGGYYIGRYETGIINEKITNWTNSTNNKNWTGYIEGTLVVQPGVQVWNYVTKDKAVELSTALYNKKDNNVSSKLCSGYAWDTALKFMESTGSTYSTDSIGGNYTNGAGNLENAGYDKAHPCNIYDMGGNVYEWTTEFCSENSVTRRGGSLFGMSSIQPASYRAYYAETYAGENVGFRISLYL